MNRAPPLAWAGLLLDRPLVMGILNVTPDSFSDGGCYATPEAAIAAGAAMREAGADIIDIGGESTRPGAAPVSAAQEIDRILPAITALAAQGAVISIDSRNAATMAAALGAGARIINDISGLTHDPAAAALAAKRGCPVVLMHTRGTPATMNTQAHYTDTAAEVLAELTQLRDAALAAGIKPEAIALDPGLGFAKLGAQNLTLLRATARFKALGHPLLIGLSRKKFIGEFGGEPNPAKRGPGSIAAGLYAVAQGAHILRVHDVPETVQALRIWQNLTASENEPSF
ncbi:dihydropteroate synthase [Acidocella aquatica]|uniref:Dihydropteroate synthase n=1 Tax=Acidocella aquatica TaxID=1922313 RepID=A0ABQ6A4A5_9PROT|nr:dihydropteroate synthase [Acidocella aquatica]GLR66473.1 dihydropteroate synthase [Acidocella aquatica]